MLKNSENGTYNMFFKNRKPTIVKCEDLDSSIFSSFIITVLCLFKLVCISYSFNYPKDELKKWDTLYNIDFRCAYHKDPHHSSDLVHNWYTKVYVAVPQNGKLMVKSPTLMF